MRLRALMQMLMCLVFVAGTATAAPGDDHIARGKAQLRANDLDAAAESFEQAIEAAPNNAEAHHLLGAAYGRLASNANMFGKLRLASKVKDRFERAVELAPDEIEYRESLIQFYAQAPAVAGGGIDKARVQAAEIGKRDAVSGQLANALIARLEKKPEDAVKAYRAAYEARPEDPRAGMPLGLYYQELKRWDDAFGHFKQVAARAPDFMPAWYQLGRTAVLANARHAEGEGALRKYLASSPGPLDPPLAAAHWRLGMLYQQMARVPDARAEYEAALKLDPEHKEARAALKQLKP